MFLESGIFNQDGRHDLLPQLACGENSGRYVFTAGVLDDMTGPLTDALNKDLRRACAYTLSNSLITLLPPFQGHIVPILREPFFDVETYRKLLAGHA